MGPACAAWAAALVCTAAPVQWVRPGALLALALGAATMSRWRWHRSPLWVLIGAAALVCAAVGASTSVRAAILDREPWSTWVDERALLIAEFEVQQRGREQSKGSFDGSAQRQYARATLVRVTEEPTSVEPVVAERRPAAAWELRAPVEVLAPLNSSQDLLQRGDRVHAQVRVTPPRIGVAEAARLTVLGPMEVTPVAGAPAVLSRGFDRALTQGPDDARALMRGMAVGDDSQLSARGRELMLNAGLSHLTAVSGANLAIVLGAVLWGARMLGVPRFAALLLGALAVGAYVWVVGPEPSVVRASAMAAVSIVAIAIGGGSGLSALAIAVCVVLVAEPAMAWSRGFALSCAATLGLIIVAGPLARWLSRQQVNLPGFLGKAVAGAIVVLAAATAASLATAPLLAGYSQGLSWMTVLANVAVAPVVPLVTIGGIGAGMAGVIWPTLAPVLAWLPLWGTRWILGVARWSETVPGGRLPWPDGVLGAITVSVLLLLLVAVARRWPRAPLVLALFTVTASLLAAVVPKVGSTWEPWQVVFCDVGQGDAALLRTGAQTAVLVDAGPEVDSGVECAERHGVRGLDAVVLSHHHADHVRGWPEVAGRYPPTQVLVPPLDEPHDQAREALGVARSLHVLPQRASVGQQLRWGQASAVVLGPRRLITAGSAPNNNSVVLLAEVASVDGALRVLWGGDLEPEGQAALMAGGAGFDIDVIKVPHHGSANQHPGLPGWTDATVAVISCGADNDYGHPADETVSAWQNSGAEVFRTDVQGDVMVGRGPQGIEVRTSRRSRGPRR